MYLHLASMEISFVLILLGSTIRILNGAIPKPQSGDLHMIDLKSQILQSKWLLVLEHIYNTVN
jgi:hypothetical protein